MKKTHLLLLWLCFFSTAAFSQISQIKIVTLQVKNTLPAKPDEWQNIPAALILTAQKPRNVEVKELKLVLQIKSNGGVVCGNSVSTAGSIASFDIKTFTTAELTGMLSGCKELPEGSYQVCAQFFNADRIAISNEVCKEFRVESTKADNYTAPTLITPENGKVFTEADLKKPINFRWTPIVPKPKEAVTYKLRVWQLMQGQNGSQAMKANLPIVTKEIDNINQAMVTNLITGPCKPPYLCDFVWQVQAVDRQGNPIGNSNGMSEATAFSVSPNKTSSSCSITVTQITSCHGSMPTTGYPTYATIPTIVNSTGQNITSWTVSTTGATLLNGLTPTDPLPSFPAVLNPGTTTAGAIIFMNPAAMPINLTYTFTLNDGSVCTVIVPIVYPPCGSATVCTCLAWPTSITYGLSTDGGTSPTFTGNIVNNGTITLTTNSFISFPGIAAPCSATPCSSAIAYSLYAPDGTVLFNNFLYFNAGILWEQPCSNSGKYKIVIKAQCGTTVCSDFIIFVDKPCPPNPCNTTLALTASPDTCTAKKGTAFVVASGGIAPYTYSWSTMPVQTTSNANSLTGGTTYTVNVTDALGCIKTGSVYVPVVNSIINLSAIPTCIAGTTNGDIVLTISGGTAPYTYLWSNTATSKDILNIASGIYTVTVTDANGCKATGTYTITCPAPCDCQTSGCTFNKNFIIQNPAGGALNPLCGSTISLQCNTDYRFDIGYNCTNQNCTPIIKVEIKDATSAVVSSGAAPLTYSFTTSGAYTITYYLIINGKICSTCTGKIEVKCKPDCCKGSYWKQSPGIYNASEVLTQTFNCIQPQPFLINSSKGNCNEAYTIKNGIFVCGNPNCISTIKYTLKDASGSTVSSGTSVIAIPATLANGNYTLLVEAYCDGDLCSTCKFEIKKDCPQTNPVDCCKGSFWKEQPKVYNTAGVLVQTLNCPQPTFSLNIINSICNETFTIKNGIYACATANCISKVEYSLVNTATNTVVLSGINFVSITPTLPNGNYVMNVYAICGTDTCSRCTFQIKKDCPQNPKPCCQGGKWLTKYYRVSAPLIKTMPMAVECGGNYNVDFIAGGNITFNADYLCNPALGNCTKQVFVSVKKPGTSFSINQPVSYSMPLNEAGTYTVCYYAKCGTDTCDSCCFTINIKEKKDCCKGGYWINKSVDWSNIIDKNPAAKMMPVPSGPVTLPATSIQITNCNSSYKLGQGGTYNFNADYFCALKDCPKNVKVKIQGLTYSGLDGIYTAPVAKTFTVAGNYMITYYAYCGDTLCDSCVFTIGIQQNCCLGSKWISADYQVVNKKPDGSWIWVPGIFPIGNSIPTLKADLGIDISNLNFQCAKGCAAQYIVRKINLSTGGLTEPDETLPPGQTTTSIYAKPFAQMVIITPTCDGQKCTPLMFRVECLHKDCVPPPLPPCNSCENKSNLIINGDFESGNTAFSSWLTYSTGTMSVTKYFVNPGTLYPTILSKSGAGNYFSIQAYNNHLNELSGKKIWKNTIPMVVKPGAKYSVCFDYYVSWQMNPTGVPSSTPGNPDLEIEVYVNGVHVAGTTALGTGTYYTVNSAAMSYLVYPWQTKNFSWTATSSTAIIEIRFKSKSYSKVAGWNFGLDDIVMKECSDATTGGTGHGNPAGNVGEAGQVRDLNLQIPNCGDWDPLIIHRWKNWADTHIIDTISNDTISNLNIGTGNINAFVVDCNYHCNKPGCSVTIKCDLYSYYSFIGFYRFESSSTSFGSAFSQYYQFPADNGGKLVFTTTCCGEVCGTKTYIVLGEEKIGSKTKQASHKCACCGVIADLKHENECCGIIANPGNSGNAQLTMGGNGCHLKVSNYCDNGGVLCIEKTFAASALGKDQVNFNTTITLKDKNRITIYSIGKEGNFSEASFAKFANQKIEKKQTELPAEFVTPLLKSIKLKSDEKSIIFKGDEIEYGVEKGGDGKQVVVIKQHKQMLIEGKPYELRWVITTAPMAFPVHCPLGYTFTPEGCVANEDLNSINKRTRVKCNCGTDIYGKDAAACERICDFLGGGSNIAKGPIKFFNYEKDFVIDALEICTDLGVKSLTIKKGVYEVNRNNSGSGGVIELTLANPIAANKIINKQPRHFEGTNPKGLNCEGPGSSCFYKSENASTAKDHGFTLTPIIEKDKCTMLVLQYDKGGAPADPGF